MATTHWTTVYAGHPGEVAVMQARLEAEGLDTFLPDEATQTADPFITGTSALYQLLQVPDEQVARAREVLGSSRPPTAQPPRPDDDTPAEPGAADEDLRDDLIEAKLNAYVLPSILFTVLGVTAPMTLITGWYYLKACERYERRARLHVVILLCIAVSLLMLSLIGVYLLFGPREATYPE